MGAKLVAEEKHMEGASCLNFLLGYTFSDMRKRGIAVLRVGVCLELSLQIQQLDVTNRNQAQPIVAPREPQRFFSKTRRLSHSLAKVFTTIPQPLLPKP